LAQINADNLHLANVLSESKHFTRRVKVPFGELSLHLRPSAVELNPVFEKPLSAEKICSPG
jgi:hypothetical protein